MEKEYKAPEIRKIELDQDVVVTSDGAELD